MRDMNLKNNCKRAAGLGLIAAGALMASQAAMACQLSAWSSNFGSPVAGDPTGGDLDGTIPRYSGFCGLATVDGAVSGVRDDSPGGIDRIRARFYVLLDNGATTSIYEGLDSTDGTVFSVEADSSGNISLVGGGATVGPIAGNDGAWNSVEIDWDPSGGGATLIVNEETPANQSVGGASPISSVLLGNLDGAGGLLYFDSYESRRTEAIGRLCPGEVTGDGDRTTDDVLEIFGTEVASGGADLVAGQPDFTEDGAVTNDDVLALFNDVVSLGAGECP